jgi:transcriptional regulator with XRE-family HTH domain
MTTILRMERLRRNMSQQEFGKLLGMPQCDVSTIERRLEPAGFKRSKRICNVLGLQRHQILDLDGLAMLADEKMADRF